MLRETDSGGFGSNCILKQGLDRGQIACRRKGGPPSQIAQITNKNRVYWVCGVQMYADLSEHDPPPPWSRLGWQYWPQSQRGTREEEKAGRMVDDSSSINWLA